MGCLLTRKKSGGGRTRDVEKLDYSPFGFVFGGLESQNGLAFEVWTKNNGGIEGFWRKKTESPSIFARSCLKIALISNDHDGSMVSRFGRFKDRFPKVPPLNEETTLHLQAGTQMFSPKC